MQMSANAILVNPRDNVAVALEDIAQGASVSILGQDKPEIGALRPIPFAHKIAVIPIIRGEAVLKYGVPIAFALVDIPAGEWVHEHNAKSYFVARREGEIR